MIIADLRPTADSTRLAKDHDRVRFIKCDVSRWEELLAIIHLSEKEFGDVPDIYVANAGVPETVSQASSFPIRKEPTL